jgi:hypothetical protein
MVLQHVGAELVVANSFGLELSNMSRIVAVPGGEGSIGARGFSANAIIIDEAAYVSDATVAMNAADSEPATVSSDTAPPAPFTPPETSSETSSRLRVRSS